MIISWYPRNKFGASCFHPMRDYKSEDLFLVPTTYNIWQPFIEMHSLRNRIIAIIISKVPRHPLFHKYIKIFKNDHPPFVQLGESNFVPKKRIPQ